MSNTRNYSIATCALCPLTGKIIKDGLCYSCYQDRQIHKYLKEIKNTFMPISRYNKHLFDLYLTYIKRYRLSYSIKNQVIQVVTLLEAEEISTIKSWFDIYGLSDQHLLYQRNSTAKGCAFIKIGKMLHELGILPPREDEQDSQIEVQLSFFSNERVIRKFINARLRRGNSKKTILKYLYSLKTYEQWLILGKSYSSLKEATSFDIEQYVQKISVVSKNSHARDSYNCIKSFYSWATLTGEIKVSPVPALIMSRPKGKINILDDHLIQKLFSFIKNPESPPEQAMMISLTLVWGLKTIDLAQASIIIEDDTFKIKLRRRPLTKGNAYYNRDEIITCPKSIKWFLDLQKSYLKVWTRHYQKIKKTFPHSPLFLNNSYNSNAYLSTASIIDRFKIATKTATGEEINNSVLRQTCGHLYSQSGDASALSSLGWSAQFAFHYTWLPREIWSK